MVPEGAVGDSLLIAGRIREGVFPDVVLERIASAGGVCKASVGGGVVIPVDKKDRSVLWKLVSCDS